MELAILRTKKANLETSNPTIKQLLEYQEEVERVIVELHALSAWADVQIAAAVAGRIDNVRQLQGKEFGAVNVTIDGLKITHTIPKSVSWDQNKMLTVFRKILAAGDDPIAYMQAKFTVSEKQFDTMVGPVKEIFAEARTVKPGKPTLKIEEMQNA